jgi:hypothetical protein
MANFRWMNIPNQIRIFLLIALLQLPVVQIFAQSSAEDSIFYTKTLNNALDIYYRSAGDQSRLYNGTEYTGYPYVFAEGHPFFLTSKNQIGSIVYDKVEYQGVDLLYDEMMGAVIFQDERHRIQLSSDRISGFTIGDNKFIRIVHDSLLNNAPETGFYNILYEGNLGVLKKEIKTSRIVNSFSQELTRVVDVKTNYYLKNNNQYVQISTQNELLNFLSPRKKEIQHYIKTNKLSFKKDTDNLLAKVAAFYDLQTK